MNQVVTTRWTTTEPRIPKIDSLRNLGPWLPSLSETKSPTSLELFLLVKLLVVQYSLALYT
jgi:hypothetical protein